MGMYRKKPVVIEATRWDCKHSTLETIGCGYCSYSGHAERPDECTRLKIKTLEGSMRVNEGDWIIKGVKGEFYPCRHDIFIATYDPAIDQA